MNILYSTMGSFFNVYFKLNESLSSEIEINPKYYVSNNRFFQRNHKDLINSSILIKEWELYDLGINENYDTSNFKRICEKYFKDESIWRSIINDRRLYNGTYCKFKQDYKSNYSETQLLNIFYYTLIEIEKVFENFKPDLVIGSTPSTLGEYLINKIAQTKGIKCIYPRHTKIMNYFTVANNLNEKYHDIEKDFNLPNNNFDGELINISKKFIKEFNRSNGVAYEGSIIKGNFLFKNFLKFIKAFPKLFIYSFFVKPFSKIDFHNKGNEFKKVLLNGIIKDLNSLFQKTFHKNVFLKVDDLKKKKFIYFPLHSEPEVAITLFSKGYYNQIELIREISFNVPDDFCVIVNEHPRNIGKRNISFYKKITSIPNVYMASYDIKSLEIVKESSLVIVLSGSLGFESALLKKPVICLGNTMYNILPQNIIRKVSSLKELFKNINDLLDKYQYDEKVIINYIASILNNSVKINFYNVLLAKNRNGKSDELKTFSNNILQLKKLILKCL